MNTEIYVMIKDLPEEARDIDGSYGLLTQAPIPTFIWQPEPDGLVTVEIQTDWPISPALQDWVERLGRHLGLAHDEIKAQVDVLSGDHLPDDAYWTDTQDDVDTRKPPEPQEPGTELSVWYRSSRQTTKNEYGELTIQIRGAWFGESFTASKEREWVSGVLAFRGREITVNSGPSDNHIPGLPAEQKTRIAFIRGVLGVLSRFTDGCYGGQADGIGVCLDEALS